MVRTSAPTKLNTQQERVVQKQSNGNGNNKSKEEEEETKKQKGPAL